MLALEGLDIRLDAFRLGADLTVPDGITAVIGPSGGGKSTLLAAIAGFVAPEGGRVVWDGRDITGLPPGDRPVAVVFQDNNLFPHLDIETNVALGIAPVARPPASAREAARDALTRVGLGGFGSRMPGELSGGQQGRAALARVLLTRRPIVLLDEPFAALGPALRHDMLELTKRLLGERTVLLVTHHPEDARLVAPLTIAVAEGRAAAPAPTGPLLDAPTPSLARYLKGG